MEVKLLLSVFVLHIQVSLAVWQRVTVLKGQKLILSCPITNADKTLVDWKNPEGYIMFFNRNQALKDKRYSINKLSESEFSISVSSVTFKDGGNYTCSQYGHHTTEKKVEVTVLGLPKMLKTKHEGKIVIKCTAEATHFAPQISWKIDEGPEVLAHAQRQQENKKHTSIAMTEIIPVDKRVTVKCLVRHPALDLKPLMNFVTIGRDSRRSHPTTSSHTVQGSTHLPRTTTSSTGHGRTAVHSTTRNGNKPSSESSTVDSSLQFSTNDPKMATATTRSPLNPVTATGPHLSTSGWTYTSETTENITIDNNTDSNTTGNSGLNMHMRTQGNSSLLVFLVTCLICGLLVVVIFFAIKLRRAHIAWKRVFIVTENEDSNQSEESSKSKSSHEEKTVQGQRRRGLFNTAFTQYVVEEPTKTMTSVQNTAAITATAMRPQTAPQTSAKCDMKETSL
ncbi:cytotoxic and regulatory T-cell molecule isoform X2 [Archocentrus centrarchus]|uniref:cytotoxic and regulatory T-cell molecule isoform X2 n=1 Tax=Archocentrus centrarchus TaxID=63155 RepID=UPI0011EA4968|nr:cytotoxic and regulatory T-cell molecule isoform X2 [Archocentrus centrarchus]